MGMVYMGNNYNGNQSSENENTGNKWNGPIWYCKNCGYSSRYVRIPSECPLCGGRVEVQAEGKWKRTGKFGPWKTHIIYDEKRDNRNKACKQLIGVVAIIAIIYLVVLFVTPALTNTDLSLIKITDDTNKATATEAFTSGMLTVIDNQDPSKSASFADGKTGVIYSNTFSFPYGSPYYVLSLTNVDPKVTITASNLIPSDTQASFDITVKDASGKIINYIRFGGSENQRPQRMILGYSGDFTIIMDGKYIKSVDIDIEKI